MTLARCVQQIVSANTRALDTAIVIEWRVVEAQNVRRCVGRLYSNTSIESPVSHMANNTRLHMSIMLGEFTARIRRPVLRPRAEQLGVVGVRVGDHVCQPVQLEHMQTVIIPSRHVRL